MILRAEHLTLTLPDNESPLFSDLSLEIGACEIGLVNGGPGSGKTILGLTCCGFLPLWLGPFELEGRIELFGRKLIQGESPLDVGVILENPYTQLSGMKKSVARELAYSLECRGMEPKKMPASIEQYAKELGVLHLLDRDVRSLSGGELQRVLIAATLIFQPRFLFLDRPLTEIDQEFRPELMGILRTHVEEVAGAAIFAEDSWLLPPTRFQRELCLDTGSEPPVALKKVSSHFAPKKHSEHGETLLLVESVSFAYDVKEPIISDLSFSLRNGEILFITGPNGSGKTTLAKLIIGILPPSSGSIVIDGSRAENMKEWERMSVVGYALQDPGLHLCRRTVSEELDLAEKLGNPAGKLTEVLGLDALLKRHPLELTQADKKKLGMAISCGGKRKILILDEPSQYQDNGGFNRIIEALELCAGEGKGVLIITHDPRFFQSFPDAGIIHLSQSDNS